ncbi:hypothetical protein LSTR_LSTR006200 [Laodelphax striatellus]|uniref:Peroxiredoxin-5 n=1 Tax=Laodelphax striatellus TaxID=195883 RepID=A0A482XQG5_LAOST|nr:hypothetical protein LSTR_LSTR006200 [Laodelphax striatellus]
MQSILVKHLCLALTKNTGCSTLTSTFLPEVSRRIHLSCSFNMPAKEGDKIPAIELYENTPANKVNLQDETSNKKVIIFGVPGAFTPGCSKTHLPGYVDSADDFKKKGFSEIFCISVNDPFVMAAWGEAHNVQGKVRMLGDPAGELTKSLGFEQNLPPLGGLRSKRFSMIVEDGVITKVNVEPDGTGLSCSLANNLKI